MPSSVDEYLLSTFSSFVLTSSCINLSSSRTDTVGYLRGSNIASSGQNTIRLRIVTENEDILQDWKNLNLIAVNLIL